MPSNTYNASAELYDLGQARFDSNTAAISDRDYALTRNNPHAPRLRAQNTAGDDNTFSWHTFHATTEERDTRAEQKDELHEGQLHRANRIAAGQLDVGAGPSGTTGMSGGRGGVMNGAAGGASLATGSDGAETNPLWAGRRPEAGGPPLAKGSAEEVGKDLFWDGPIRGEKK